MTPDDERLIADCEERCVLNDHAIIPGLLKPLLELTKRLAKELEDSMPMWAVQEMLENCSPASEEE